MRRAASSLQRHDLLLSVAPYLACAFLPLFVFFFACGPGSIPFFYVSEVFPSSVRASASAVCVAVNWTFTIIVGLAFLPLDVSVRPSGLDRPLREFCTSSHSSSSPCAAESPLL